MWTGGKTIPTLDKAMTATAAQPPGHPQPTPELSGGVGWDLPSGCSQEPQPGEVGSPLSGHTQEGLGKVPSALTSLVSATSEGDPWVAVRGFLSDSTSCLSQGVHSAECAAPLGALQDTVSTVLSLWRVSHVNTPRTKHLGKSTPRSKVNTRALRGLSELPQFLQVGTRRHL